MKIRLQYQRRYVPMYDLKYADHLDLDVPDGTEFHILDVNAVGQEYSIDFITVSPAPDDEDH